MFRISMILMTLGILALGVFAEFPPHLDAAGAAEIAVVAGVEADPTSPALMVLAQADAAQVAVDNWGTIFDFVSLVLMIVAPGIAGLWVRNRKSVQELVELIDDSKPPNRDFKTAAESMGKRAAARALKKLTG